MGKRTVLSWSDAPFTKARGWLVLDSIINEVSGGGTFLHENCTLKEVTDLARDMTYKNILNPIPFGGAKAGIQYSHSRTDAKDVLERFLVFCRKYLLKNWATGADLNTCHKVIDHIIQTKLDLNSGLSVLGRMYADNLGLPDQTYLVNHLLAQSVNNYFDLVTSATGYILAGLIAHFANNEPIKLMVHGFGNVGSSLAFYAHKYSNITVVGISDLSGCLVNEDGIDIEQILKLRQRASTVTSNNLSFFCQDLPGKWLLNNFSNSYEFLSFYLESMQADCVSLCADRYSVNEKVLKSMVKHCFNKSRKKMLLCGANKVFLNDDLISSVLDYGVIYLPTWFTSSGNSLLFAKLLSSINHDNPQNILADISNYVIQLLLSSQDKYGKNIYTALYSHAHGIMNQMLQEKSYA